MTTWRNRIVGEGEAAPDQLLANPSNWRTHPGSQADALRGVLADVGWVQRVIVNQRTGYLVDGHLRVMEALKAGAPSVPVVYVDLSPEEEALILATLDPLAAMAGIDAAQLDALLREVSTDSPAVAAMLDELAQAAGIVPGSTPGTGGDEFDASPAEGPTRAQRGELWLIDGGRHRLVVGDSTDAATVARLFGGDKAEMVWTDPPYGVAIGDKNKFLSAIARSNRAEEHLANDNLDEPALLEMLRAAFANADAHCLAGGAWYVAAPAGPLHVLFGMALKERGIWHQTIQWVKNNATFAPMGVDYHWRAEPIFYGWKPGAPHRYYGGRQQDTVWEIDRPRASPDHPTMKPVGLVQRAVKNSSRPDEIVYDAFGGSGTTLVAAHYTRRRAYLCELEPRYADVILRRAEAEGLTVERADD